MADIIKLSDKKKEKEKPHRYMTGEAKCIKCNHKWVAVAPVGTTELECTECKTMSGSFMYLVEPPDEWSIWLCDCGGTAFHICYDTNDELRMFCMNCGCTSVGWEDE